MNKETWTEESEGTLEVRDEQYHGIMLKEKKGEKIKKKKKVKLPL
jgi:hypothetical protein